MKAADPGPIVAPFKVLMVAGDPSGDAQGARVALGLQRRLPGVHIYGVGASCMRDAGALVLFDSSDYSAIGVAESLRRIPRLWRVFRSLKGLMAASPPDLVFLIDFPAFNLRLARIAQVMGLPVLYYFPPASWRKEMSESVRRVASLATRVATPFPWSAELIRQAGGSAEFVGHPLLELAREMEADRGAAKPPSGPAGAPILALFPGSRRREVRHILPIMLEAAREILKAHPEVRPMVSRARAVPEPWIRRNAEARLPQAVIRDDGYRLMAEASVGMIKSGTTTLEAAVMGLPHVACYAGSWIDRMQYYVLARRSIRFIALPNILADRLVVPELYGSTLSVRSLAAAALALLEDEEVRATQRQAFSEILHQLTPLARGVGWHGLFTTRAVLDEGTGNRLPVPPGAGATERVCEMAAEMLVGRSPGTSTVQAEA